LNDYQCVQCKIPSLRVLWKIDCQLSSLIKYSRNNQTNLYAIYAVTSVYVNHNNDSSNIVKQWSTVCQQIVLIGTY